MPVTQRWVHSGLVLVAGILSLSLTVLILGASRPTISTSGLVGSVAPQFTLKDRDGDWVKLKDNQQKVTVLVIAPAFASPEKQFKPVQQLEETFGNDPAVKFAGIEFDPRAGLLKQSSAGAGPISTALPSLNVLQDIDSSVAMAYRVGATPVLFVIDGGGVIRARVALDSDGAGIVASETINSLRDTGLTMPMTATDRKS